jgi:signal transduction histidine kinase
LIKVSITSDRAQNICILEIEDTGPGIPEELLLQLGKPYLQAKNASSRQSSGIGLGLRITKQLASSMHCNLKFMRGASGGTLVHLAIPLAQNSLKLSIA